VVDVRVGGRQQPRGAADPGDGAPGERGGPLDPRTVLVGRRAADVLPVPQPGHVLACLVQDHFQLLQGQVVQPGGVGAPGIAEGDFRADVPVLERCGDQPAGLADHEMGL
jgi:hypothetical protein